MTGAPRAPSRRTSTETRHWHGRFWRRSSPAALRREFFHRPWRGAAQPRPPALLGGLTLRNYTILHDTILHGTILPATSARAAAPGVDPSFDDRDDLPPAPPRTASKH